jgi:hypothetical protein
VQAINNKHKILANDRYITSSSRVCSGITSGQAQHSELPSARIFFACIRTAAERFFSGRWLIM